MPYTDWKYPGTGASVSPGSPAWSDPAHITEDATYAEASGTITSTEWLRGTNFGFTTTDVPTGATIVGVEVRIRRYAQYEDRAYDDSLRLLDADGAVTGDDKADTVNSWPLATGDTVKTYGASDDDWNAGLTDTDIRDTSFGVQLKATTTSESVIRVRFYEVRIHYEEPVDLTAKSISATPELEKPSIGQEHALTAKGITATPELGKPNVGEIDSLEAKSIAVTPAFSKPELAEFGTDALTAKSISVTPELGKPTIAQIHVLPAKGLAVTAEFEKPTIAQVHALEAKSIEVTPALGTPAIGIPTSILPYILLGERWL